MSNHCGREMTVGAIKLIKIALQNPAYKPANFLKMIPISDDSIFRDFLAAMLETNRSVNLTAVRDPELAWIKHVVDSLQGLQTGIFDDAKTAIDIGTGAGFPGMILALACPQMKVTLLDSTRKKCDFLQSYIDSRNLGERVKVLLGRAESWGNDGAHREKYDVATTRAVGSFGEVCELSIPFVNVGGHVILWRGKDAIQEIKNGKKVLLSLGAKLINCDSYQLPNHELTYHLVVLQKVKATNKRYPRRTGLPKKKPLS